MKIFVLQEMVDYEGAYFVGVFSSFENAIKVANNFIKEKLIDNDEVEHFTISSADFRKPETHRDNTVHYCHFEIDLGKEGYIGIDGYQIAEVLVDSMLTK